MGETYDHDDHLKTGLFDEDIKIDYAVKKEMRKHYEEKYTSAGNLDTFGANEHEKMHILCLKI